uniref:Uncharacterized protein n=1 Tax=Arundo donax TaxID=35708 RepID=A0A0A9EQ39_ARUDO
MNFLVHIAKLASRCHPAMHSKTVSLFHSRGSEDIHLYT